MAEAVEVEMLVEVLAVIQVGMVEVELEDVVELIHGDARDYLPGYPGIAFCFLDAEKEVYADCYELVVPNLVRGGLLVADNAINHRETLQPMIDRAYADHRVDALVVSVGKGELICRKA